MKLVILDNGHGEDTPGKRSPDGSHREYMWCRRAVAAIAGGLEARGLEVAVLVPEEGDVSLAERCRRANALARGRDAIVVSVHNNASGSGVAWGTACGWSVFVAPTASEASRRLASTLYGHAAAAGILGNRCTPPAGYWTAPLAICRRVMCPAVLTENMFQDNRTDVAFLQSEAGFRTVVDVHIRAITEYFGL